MKMKSLLIVGAGLLLLAWWEKQHAPTLDALPINPPPADQAVLNAMFPSVDAQGNICNPVNESAVFF